MPIGRFLVRKPASDNDGHLVIYDPSSKELLGRWYRFWNDGPATVRIRPIWMGNSIGVVVESGNFVDIAGCTFYVGLDTDEPGEAEVHFDCMGPYSP